MELNLEQLAKSSLLNTSFLTPVSASQSDLDTDTRHCPTRSRKISKESLQKVTLVEFHKCSRAMVLVT